jgi:1-acyl-sn-glycerol-3-phosphate acyltransferase
MLQTLKKLAQKTAQVVYSAGVWSVSFAWMAAVSVTWAITSSIAPKRFHQGTVGAPGMAVCLNFTLSDFEFIYDPDFDPERRSVFCQNHVNLMDAHVACAVIPHAFCGLMNSWQFKIPFYGWIMKLADGIPVRSGSSNRYREIAIAARDRAAKGISILVFPEAHRTVDGKVHEFKKGVFLMAREAGLPVVPLATRGMYELNRKGTWLFTPTKVTVYIGAQIETAGITTDELRKVISRTEQIIRDFTEHGIIPGKATDDPAPAGELTGS